MEIIEKIRKTREYLNYIEEHCLNVLKAWQEMQQKCKDMNFIYDDFLFFQIDIQIKEHDLSKLSEDEFVQYRQVFYPTKQEITPYPLDSAWEHHKKHNPHHWENWTKMKFKFPNEWVIYCVQMIVDWMAMGYKFNDTAEDYYTKNKDKIKLPKYALPFIEDVFSKLQGDPQNEHNI